MRLVGRSAGRLLAAALLVSLVWWGGACGGDQAKTPQLTPAERGVTLEAELHHPGLLVLRSPTFRWAKEYCAGVVISALEQSLGKDTIRWETAAVPNQLYVELQVTYDPAQLTADDIVAATTAAMEAHPDPGHPGPVRVRRRGWWGDAAADDEGKR